MYFIFLILFFIFFYLVKIDKLLKKKDVDVTFFYNILIPPTATLATFVG